MSEKNKNIVILLLVVSAVLLGGLTFSKYNKKELSGVSQEVSGSQINIIDKTQFSDDEIKLLRPPQQGASQAEIDEHAKLAAKYAKAGDTVDLKDCKAGPIVLQNSLKSKSYIKNSGKTEVSVSFDGKKNLLVTPGASVGINSELVHGVGLYGYVCERDGFKGLVGFVMITP